ncbi:MAG: sigma factor-like helix-turn-helix DNA-binding protein [Thermodesulfobacteriota bacterium]
MTFELCPYQERPVGGERGSPNSVSHTSGTLEALPDDQRMVVILRRYDDLSYAEIAGIMDCSVFVV